MRCRLLILLFMLGIISLGHATDPWGEPVYYPGSMVVMAQVSINGSPAADGDVLGAFAYDNGDYELRGKANVTVVNGISGCLLQLFCASDGEIIRFRIWDEAASAQYEAQETVATEVNGMIGSYPDDLFPINGVDSQMTIDPWGEPQILANSTGIWARVMIDDEDAEEQDILAAFVVVDSQAQLRGKAEMQIVGNQSVVQIQIYGILPAEEIIFQIWDFDQQQILEAQSSVLSLPGAEIGSGAQNALLINTGTGIEQIPPLQINPPGGNYSEPQTVEISSQISGVEIYYSLDGSDPDQESFLFEDSISLVEGSITELRARAYHSSQQWYPSLIQTELYSIATELPLPSINPPGGSFSEPQVVEISCDTPNSLIYYTLDGTDPTQDSSIYAGTISINESCLVKARAYKNGCLPSAVASAEFSIIQTVANPVFTPAPGTYNAPIVLQMFSQTPATRIHYTLDGSEPDEDSTLYTGPMLIEVSTLVRARAYRNTWLPSEISDAQYILPLSSAQEEATPVVPGIQSAYPNPSSASINFSLRTKGLDQEYHLRVYNLKGQCVFSTSGRATGVFELSWDARDASGNSLPRGVYFASFRQGKQSSIRRLVLI